MKSIQTAVLLLLVACGAPVVGTDGGSGGGTGGGTGGAGGGSSTSQPLVTSTNPPDNGSGVAINIQIAATFSTAMDPATLASAFTVKQGAATVAGTVVFAGSTATFLPAAVLTASTAFTATISTGAKSASGVAMAAAYTWTFTTGTTASLGPAPVGLGTAGNYVVLAKTAVSSVPSSVVTGAIGLSPAAASFVTGFSLVADANNAFSTSAQVTGKIYAADYAVPTPSNLTTAVSNMESAYTDAATRPTPDHLELGTGAIGGLTLAPGLYKWTSTLTIASNVTINGGANDVWIFQTSGDLTMTAAKTVTLTGGALAKNVFWQVAGKTTIGAGAHFEGILLSKTDVTLETGATMKGRVLAQTQVALQKATISQP